MFALGIVGGVSQAIAHLLMVNPAQRERNPLARYVVGCLIIFFAFWIGWDLDKRQHPVIGLGYIILMSGIAVAACYYVRERRQPKPTDETPDADRFLDALNREINEP